MTTDLTGQRIAFLATHGVEQVELSQPWLAVRSAGGEPRLVSPADGEVQAFNHDVEKGDTFPVDVPLSQANAEDFDALVIPGGTTNPDTMRLEPAAMAFIAVFVDRQRPIASICHGPWMLVETGIVRGKTLTSWPSLATDIRNAGGNWVDAEVKVCGAEDWPLVTSRKPDDLPAFNHELVRVFSSDGASGT